LDLSGFANTDGGSGAKILAKISATLTALSTLSLCDWDSVTHWEGDWGKLQFGFPALSELDLSGCSNLEGCGLATILGNCSKLTSLDLQGCYSLSAAHLWSGYCRELQFLSLEDCRHLTESDSLSIVAGSQGLTSLNITGSCFEAENLRVTDSVCAQIAALPKLSELLIGGSACTIISDVGLAKIATMKNLTFLSLYDCQSVTAAGLAKASCGFGSLRSLEMTYYNQISRIASSIPPGITSLGLCGCGNLTDGDLALIAAGLPKLGYLDLTECGQVTKAGLAHFHFVDRKVEVVADDDDLTNCDNTVLNTLCPYGWVGHD
jgi:hypothetical protein